MLLSKLIRWARVAHEKIFRWRKYGFLTASSIYSIISSWYFGSQTGCVGDSPAWELWFSVWLEDLLYPPFLISLCIGGMGGACEGNRINSSQSHRPDTWQQMVLRQLDSYMQKNKVGPYFISCTKSNSKWILDLYERAKTIILLQDNIELNLCVLGH